MYPVTPDSLFILDLGDITERAATFAELERDNADDPDSIEELRSMQVGDRRMFGQCTDVTRAS